MNINNRLLLILLIILNIVVLAGQVWPAGAPPFARTVNIIFLIASLLYFILTLSGKNRKL